MIVIELDPLNRKDVRELFKKHGERNVDALYVKAFQKRWDLFFNIGKNYIQVSEYFWELSKVCTHIKNQTRYGS
jgi:hypothetical protein